MQVSLVGTYDAGVIVSFTLAITGATPNAGIGLFANGVQKTTYATNASGALTEIWAVPVELQSLILTGGAEWVIKDDPGTGSICQLTTTLDLTTTTLEVRYL